MKPLFSLLSVAAFALATLSLTGCATDGKTGDKPASACTCGAGCTCGHCSSDGAKACTCGK